MKKLLLIVLVAAALVYGCKKDPGTNVTVNTSDMAVINGELKGLWLFPTNLQTVNDMNGKLLASNGYIDAPVFQFDGGSGVTIIDNLQTKSTGTYQLSTKDGLIYLDITDSKGNDITYQVLSLTSGTLKMVSKTPYTFYQGESPIQAQVVSNIVVQKQTSADVTGNLVKVLVTNDAVYNIDVAVTHTTGADTAVLLDTKQSIKGAYTFAFPSKSGDQLDVDMQGDYTTASFYAYYNGIPLTGVLNYGSDEFKTATGWKIP